MEGIQTFKGSWPWPWIRPCGIPLHHSSTSTYIPNFIQIEKNFLWTDGLTYRRTFSPSNIIRSTFGSRPNNKIMEDGRSRKFQFHPRGIPAIWDLLSREIRGVHLENLGEIDLYSRLYDGWMRTWPGVILMLVTCWHTGQARPSLGRTSLKSPRTCWVCPHPAHHRRSFSLAGYSY